MISIFQFSTVCKSYLLYFDDRYEAPVEKKMMKYLAFFGILSCIQKIVQFMSIDMPNFNLNVPSQHEKIEKNYNFALNQIII